ncbi:MAG TPA: peptidoglycan DD-metalloendopeptidase family protein [Rhodanobacteraceae bacterium]|nr:peptidoglycan DD-metalloendopeptidase family protein [Rhodanobacteraceae bacterium]
MVAPTKAQTSASGIYRVQRGDTLYSIAFRHGIDYRELAEWNSIEPPYTIYPGRELRLSSARSGQKRVVAAVPAAPPSSSPTTSPAAAPLHGATSAAKPGPFEPSAAPPSAASARPPSSAPTASSPIAPPVASATKSPPAPVSDATVASVGDVAWRWPADGSVVGTFTVGDPVKQGIDIAGQPGAPVRAAADGTVVYSGNGLIGYGELIIVKHNPAFLSAYGHNRKRLVQEGDHVKAGQTIAEMGASAANRNELHFEIRRNGKPANPLDYLPRR